MLMLPAMLVVVPTRVDRSSTRRAVAQATEASFAALEQERSGSLCHVELLTVPRAGAAPVDAVLATVLPALVQLELHELGRRGQRTRRQDRDEVRLRHRQVVATPLMTVSDTGPCPGVA